MTYARGARRRGEVGDEVPLVYQSGYIHVPCGGPAERPNHPRLGMYCINEDRHAPASEFKKESQ
jgi:hypothetical protein